VRRNKENLSVMNYFSDQENGPRPQVQEDISSSAWGGIVAVIDPLIVTGAFGEHFPLICPDGGTCIIGTDTEAMGRAVRGEISEIQWPLATVVRIQDGFSSREESYTPHTVAILDLIQFCYVRVAKPIQGSYHSFFGHYHLRFSEEDGKEEFRGKINRIFSRNGLAYELQEDGTIVRLAPPILLEELTAAVFESGDSILDRMLADARNKFVNPNVKVRREALEKLWDAWERLKSLEDPANKRNSIGRLLDWAASEPNFRKVLENEAKALTDIGNTFHIRHFETDKTEIQGSLQVDHLFHRMFSMIWLLLRARSW